mgnify:CR=1 FL=1
MADRAYADTDWLSRKEAAIYLHSIGCPVHYTTLAHKAAGNNRGSGPPFTRVGWRSVRYRVSDLRAWAEKTAQRIE